VVIIVIIGDFTELSPTLHQLDVASVGRPKKNGQAARAWPFVYKLLPEV